MRRSLWNHDTNNATISPLKQRCNEQDKLNDVKNLHGGTDDNAPYGCLTEASDTRVYTASGKVSPSGGGFISPQRHRETLLGK